MSYQSRIPADQGYIKALGTAFYNFTYLEWTAIWIIVKLCASGFDSVPTGTAGYIAKALKNAIDTTSPPLSAALRKKLLDFHQSFVIAKGHRNKLGGWPGLWTAGAKSPWVPRPCVFCKGGYDAVCSMRFPVRPNRQRRPLWYPPFAK